MTRLNFYRDNPKLEITYELQTSLSQYKTKRKLKANTIIINPKERSLFEPVAEKLGLSIIEDKTLKLRYYTLDHVMN